VALPKANLRAATPRIAAAAIPLGACRGGAVRVGIRGNGFFAVVNATYLAT
jgi:hypothetical protein